MTNRFDWQTAEDGEWPDVGPARYEPKRRRRWLWFVIILGAFVLAAGAVFWQVRERIASAEAARKNDILSSYYLIHQAIDERDTELFRNLLSGRDAEWAMAQQELFANDWLFDLSAFGLTRRPAQPNDAEIELSPELDSGEVSAVSTYGLQSHGSESGTIRLQQTSVFRRGERWVWSPPRDEFWGGNALASGRYVAVSYPERDEQISRRLQRDLDGIVTRLCLEVDEISCPSRLEIYLALSRKPSTLFEVTERFASEGWYGTELRGRLDGRLNGNGRLELTMPTPTLIGLPMDEDGYQALLRGYATHLVFGLSKRLIDEECCGTEARYRAALQVMMNDLGLQRWPAVMTMMVDAAGDRPAESQVALLCSDGFKRSQLAFLMDLDQGQWQTAPLELGALSIKEIPDGEGVLVLGQSVQEDLVRNQVWAVTPDGARLVFEERTDQFEPAPGWEIQERPRRLVISFPDEYRGYTRYITFDLRKCLRGDCQSPEYSMSSRPVWSPDGSRSLVREYGLLWRRQGFSSEPVADGTAPFWLDEQTFGYVTSAGRQQAVVVTTVEGHGRDQVVLTSADLFRAFEAEQLPPRLLIGQILAGADQTRPWHVLVFDVDRRGGLGQARFIAYDPETHQVTLVPHAGRLLSFNMSPSAQRLATAGYDEEEGRWIITVTGQRPAIAAEHRLATGGLAGAVPSYTWSADEEWLLILEQGVLTLFNPSTGSYERIAPPAPGCVQAAWYGAIPSINGDEGPDSALP